MLGMVHNVLKKQNTKAQFTELEFMCRLAKKLNFLYKLRRRHLLDVRSVTADLHTDSVVHLQKIDTIHHTNNRSKYFKSSAGRQFRPLSAVKLQNEATTATL